MTANQLAYAALQESSRHNLAGEAETTRHNTEDEKIRNEANSITKELGRLQDERERQKIQYDKEYKDYSIALEHAKLEEKEWYDFKLTSLQEAEIENQRKFNEDTTRLKSQLNDLEAQKVANDKAYKEAWKDVQYLNADLQNKRIEYEATIAREEMENRYAIQQSINALTQWRDTANYVLSMENTSQKWSDLRNQQKQLQMRAEELEAQLKNIAADTSNKKSQTFKNYFSSIMDAINETAANGLRAFDLFGGNAYGKAKKAAEALFTD